MLTLDSLFAQVAATKPDAAALVADFVPPPRFAAKSFDSYLPLHPSQAAAAARIREIAAALAAPRHFGLLDRLRRKPPGRGVYLDGGFGVGKTHLLASLWNAATGSKSYLSFDELMYFVGLYGRDAPRCFTGHRLIAIDEWEMDDPGNLMLALAFLRAALADGAFVAVTSNTLPLDLGAGRFSQKDFRAEIDELATTFEVVRVEGEDYRHRRYAARPGLSPYWPDDRLEEAMDAPGAAGMEFGDLLRRLASVHPIRYREAARRVGAIYVRDIEPIGDLPTALRWVHFVDSIYDARVTFGATGSVPLEELFPQGFLEGPFGKKLSRCLSRLEEMLGGSRQSTVDSLQTGDAD